MTDEEIIQTIYGDFVYFKNSPQMLKDTFMLYVSTPGFSFEQISKAKKQFEKDYDTKIE